MAAEARPENTRKSCGGRVMFDWSWEKIRFFADAAAEVGFYDEIARRIAPHLEENANLCDAGCGLGFLARALVPYCAHVTAIDRSEDAIRFLKKEIASEKNIYALKEENAPADDIRFLKKEMSAGNGRNPEIFTGDVFSLPSELRFDAIVCCFFGNTRDILKLAAKHCSGKLFVIKKEGRGRRFDVRRGESSRQVFSDLVEELESLGIHPMVERFELEMGQPFRSLKDAGTFLKLYSGDHDMRELSEQEILQRVDRQENESFPYFMHAARTVGMAVIDIRGCQVDVVKVPVPLTT